MKNLNPRGVTLIEMSLAIVVLGLTAAAVIQVRFVSSRGVINTEDKSFAKMKSNQMLEELLARANSSSLSGTTSLEGYSDGAQYNLILSTDKNVTNPADPLSGNRQTNGHWKYLRQVQINPLTTDAQSVQIYIRIWRCASDGNPLVPGLLLSSLVETLTVGSTLASPPTFLSSAPLMNPQPLPTVNSPSGE